MENNYGTHENGFSIQDTNQKYPWNSSDETSSNISTGLIEDNRSQNNSQNVPERNLNFNSDETTRRDICGALIDNRDEVDHLKEIEHSTLSQEDLNLNKCKYCGKMFKLRFFLNRHIEKCPKNIAGNNKKNISIPILILSKQDGVWKSEQKRIICKTCFVEFDCQDSLSKHMTMHKKNNTNKVIKCEDCHNNFSSHDKSNFICQKCEIIFNNSQILNLHSSYCTRSFRKIWNEFLSLGASMSHNRNLDVSINQNMNNASYLCTKVTGRNESDLHNVREPHELMAYDNDGNIRHEITPCIDITGSNYPNQLEKGFSTESIIPIESQNLITNNNVGNVKNEKDSSKDTSRINNSNQLNAANSVSTMQTASHNSMINNYVLNTGKEKVSSIKNVKDVNDLEYIDQTDAVNNADLTVQSSFKLSLNLMMSNCDLKMKKYKFIHTNVNKNDSTGVADAHLTNTINNISGEREPEDYHLERGTEYNSIIKFQTFQNVSSVATNQTYSNVVRTRTHTNCEILDSEINHNEVQPNINNTTNSESEEPQVFSAALENREKNSSKIKANPKHSSSSNITTAVSCGKKLKKHFNGNKGPKLLPSKTVLRSYQRLNGKHNRKLRSAMQSMHTLLPNQTSNINSKSFCCKYCDKIFSSRGLCTNHEKSHIPIQNTVIVKGLKHQPVEMKNGKQSGNDNPIQIISKKRKRQIFKTDLKFSCNICPQRFGQQCSLSNHMTLFHRIKNPKLSIKQLAKPSNLNNGIKNINSVKSVNKTLSTEFNTNPSVSAHRNLNSTIDIITDNVLVSIYCKICNRQFKNCISLSNHMRIHSKKILFECEHCDSKFSRKVLYNKHMKSHLNKNKKNTDLSNVYIRRNNERQQEENSSNFDVVKSPFIDQLSKTNSTKINRLWFPCDVCEKKYSTPFQLILHRRSHCNFQPYLCKICNKSFDVRHQWNRHVKTHYRKNKPKNKSNQPTNTLKLCMSKIKIEPKQHRNQFKCEYCKKIYYSISQLKNHIKLSKECRRHGKSNLTNLTSPQIRKNFTKSKQFKCNICKKTYSKQHNYKYHMINTHKLLNASSLKTSINKYVSEPKIKIKTAKMRQNSIILNQNKISVTSNDKSNQCQLCDKSYSTKSNLYRHYTVHHKDVYCISCNMLFKHKASLNGHLRRKHRQLIPSKIVMGDKKNMSLIEPTNKYVITQYFCKICKIKFTDNMKLEEHIKKIHLKRYQCVDCGQMFKTNVTLAKHISNYHFVNTTSNANNHA